MAFHHKYLTKKSWHVLNQSNRQAVELAEATAASLQRRVDERLQQLTKDREKQEHQSLIGQRKNLSGQATSVAFMYEPPPGYVKETKIEERILPIIRTEMPKPAAAASTTTGGEIKSEVKREVHDLTDSSSTHATLIDTSSNIAAIASSSSTAFIPLSQLPMNAPPVSSTGEIESYASRRARHSTMTPQQIREELHPALKGAPVIAAHVRDGQFRAKPLGVLLRDTRCIKCGGIGHASSDRECPRYNEPSNLDAARMARDDPLVAIQGHASSYHDRGECMEESKHNSVHDSKMRRMKYEQDIHGNTTTAAASSSHRSGTVYDLLPSSPTAPLPSSASSFDFTSTSLNSSSSSLSSSEREFLASLSESDMKLLLKKLKRERRKDEAGEESSDEAAIAVDIHTRHRSRSHRSKREKKHKNKSRHRERRKDEKAKKRKRSRSRYRSSSSSSSDDDTRQSALVPSSEKVTSQFVTSVQLLLPSSSSSIPLTSVVASNPTPHTHIDDLPPLE